MSDTLATTSTKAPPDTEPPAPETMTTTVEGPDGQSLPIEITLNEPADDTTPTDSRASRSPVRAWPLALFGTEAATTGASALYTAAGTTGVLAAAGVAAGGGVIAAAAAARRARRNSRAGRGGGGLGSGRGGSRSALGSTGRSGGGSGPRGGSRTGGTGRRTGLGTSGRSGGSGRGGGAQRSLGAVSTSASKPRTGPRSTSPSGGGASLPKQPRNGLGSSPGGRSPSRAGLGQQRHGNDRQDASGGRAGILRRLGLRRDKSNSKETSGFGGDKPGTDKAQYAGPTSKGPARSTLRAWTRRAARTAMRGVAAARGLGRKAADSPTTQSMREQIRNARRAALKKGKAGMRYLLRSALAKVAAGAVGALALVPGLLLRGLAATAGGLLRFLRLAPRNGVKWGARFTRWSIQVAKAVHTRLMRKAKNAWTRDTRPDALTDFDEPGHTRPLNPADPFGTDYFGGNLVSVFQRETEAVRDAYATYEPPMMLAVAAEYWGLPEGVTSVAEAVRQLAVNTADKYPADAKMADLVAQVYALLHHAAQKAAEVGPLFAKVHEHDLRRYEEPRPGEHMWNILERRQDGGFDQRQPSQFVAVSQDVAHVYARYEPGHMNQVAAEYEGVPAGIENVAAAINLLQVRSNDRYPVDKQIVDAIADIHQLLMAAASAAQELMPNFRRLHAPDISRHEAPRNGEEGEAMWDV
ncbi:MULTISPECIES: hypothetical protein [Streptomyces]|uniref:Uncharacterized protein n=1 Tax=Streptomyces flavovirens TaxID=52258 RepID=A0ABV8NAW8_9ACTN|nr:hypothetical protein [Streptomyces sp. MBT51]MBK3596160.1 hypothetical protein [Streptomyces sp. MBT51]